MQSLRPFDFEKVRNIFRDAVLVQLEVVPGEAGNRISLLVGDHHIDVDDTDVDRLGELGDFSRLLLRLLSGKRRGAQERGGNTANEGLQGVPPSILTVQQAPSLRARGLRARIRTGRFKPPGRMKIPMAVSRQMQATKQDPLRFSKMAGGGNDFVVIDNRSARVADAVELTKRICTAHLSVGADGLILVETSTSADFRMRYFNNDGSGGEFCANGTRCAARYAVLHGIAPMKMAIETDVGIVGAEVGGGTVTLSLPSPHGFRSERPLRIGDRVVRGSSIVMGVPHYEIGRASCRETV